MTTIMVVADETWVLNDVRAALSTPHYHLSEVRDPREVTEHLDTETPDAVVVDFQVGSMGGMAVTRAIRNAGAVAERPTPPVVLMLDRDADAFLAGRSGAATWVRKPFSARALREAIDGALQRSRV